MLTRSFSSVEVHLHTRRKVRTDRFHVSVSDTKRAGGNRAGFLVEGAGRGEDARAAIESDAAVIDFRDGALASRRWRGKRVASRSDVALRTELYGHLAKRSSGAFEVHASAVHRDVEM